MNHRDNVKLEFDQQTAGMEYGEKIARITIERFPDGFKDEVGDEIAKIVEVALASVIKALKANGMKRRFREPFEIGFYIAVRNTFAEYANDCRARAMKEAA